MTLKDITEKKVYLTTDEVAELLRVDAQTVRRMANNKNIPAKKVGKSWRFSVERLKEWMGESTTVAS